MFDVGPNLTTIFLALIAAIGSAIAAFFAFRASNKAGAAVDQSQATHNLVDGRMNEMLRLTQASSRAEGVVAGRGDAPAGPLIAQPPIPDVAPPVPDPPR